MRVVLRSRFPVLSWRKGRKGLWPEIPALGACLLVEYGTPSPLVYENHRVAGSFWTRSLKNKDLYQSISE